MARAALEDVSRHAERLLLATKERYWLLAELMSPLEKRSVSAAAAFAIHGLFLAGILIGLHTEVPIGESEVFIELDSIAPLKANSAHDLRAPALEAIQSRTYPPGRDSPNWGDTVGRPPISSPAEAIATEHAFPVLPVNVIQVVLPVRLLLSITQSGMVDNAEILESSGLSEIDDAAVAWVKEHWRYTPATQNGEAIATTTTAIVRFLR